MLTRLYIDNFRCFEKFEWKPGRKQLILGRNGSGKTSLMDAVKGLIAFAAYGDRVDRSFRESDRTKWLNQPSQAFGLEADVDGQKCEYELRLAEQGAVQIEAVTAGGASLQFEDGEAIIYPTDSAPGFAYKLDERRSALSTTGDGRFLPFRNWLGGISCWRINPRSMGSWAEGEDREPREDLAMPPPLGSVAVRGRGVSAGWCRAPGEVRTRRRSPGPRRDQSRALPGCAAHGAAVRAAPSPVAPVSPPARLAPAWNWLPRPPRAAA